MIVGGNTAVVLASRSLPLTAVSFAEVLQAGDVPKGVVNVLTGFRDELVKQFASHMDVNAIVCTDADEQASRDIQTEAARNIKRVVSHARVIWSSDAAQGPYLIKETQETKTTWHPIGN